MNSSSLAALPLVAWGFMRVMPAFTSGSTRAVSRYWFFQVTPPSSEIATRRPTPSPQLRELSMRRPSLSSTTLFSLKLLPMRLPACQVAPWSSE